jgi:type I restriction enzyme S subunit
MKTVKLGVICESINGLWTGKKGPFETAKVVRNTNFTKDCRLDLSSIAILEVESRQLATRRLYKGDLIIEKSGGGPKQPVGRVVLFEEEDHDFSFSNFTSVLRIRQGSGYIPKYLYYFIVLQYITGVTETMQSNTTGIRNLNFKQYLDMDVPNPSLPEQKAIVEKLDAAFAEIDQLEELCIRNLNAVSELHRAYIHGLLSRIDVTPKYLNQISENFDSKRRPITKSSRNAGEYPYYGASGIVDYVEEYIFDGEYLLISEDGANLLARSAPIAFPAHGKFWVNNHAHIIQCSTLMDQTFLKFFFNSTDVSAFVTGAAQPKLSQASLHKIPIPFPDTASERAQIVSRIESSSTEIETLLSNLKSQRKMYSELRSSFLSSVFTEKSDAA